MSKFGLSDTYFDAEVQSNEIDHDFFDNPCGSSISEGSEVFHNHSRGDHVEPCTGDGNVCQRPNFQLNLDMTAPRPKSEDDLVTPDTCVPSPNTRFFPPPTSRHIFSTAGTGQVGNHYQGNESGQHSTVGDDFRTRDEYVGPFIQDSLQSRQELIDLSSSSSEDEQESDVESEGHILDTEDEEFVDLLGKYYDYIDLGESENSDLTEVSPISSFSGSPHPSFGPFHVPVTTDHADPVYRTNDRQRQVDNVGRSTKLPPAKPLPPLIIHTLEEVPIIRPRPATFAKGFIIPTNEEPFPESLLMKVRPAKESPRVDDVNPTSSSSMSTSNSNTSSLFQRKSETTSRHSSSTVHADLCVHTENVKQGRKSDRKFLDSIKGNQLTHVKGSIQHHRYGYHHHQPVKASATIARQRQQRRIDHENSILVRRLQRVKPSKEIVDAFKTGTNNLKCTF